MIKNIKAILLHGLHGNLGITYEPYLEEEMLKRNIKLYQPCLSTNEGANFNNWVKELDNYLYENNINLDEDTIIVSRCLGTRFILKYVALKKLKIKALISIAGFLEDDIGKEEHLELLKDFYVSDKEIEKSMGLIDNRFAIYGDKDYLCSVEQLENYATRTDSKKEFIEGLGHCGNSSGIKKLPKIVEIIDQLQE